MTSRSYTGNILDSPNAGTVKGSHELLIYYEDTDLSGFVYHSNYLKFFERAREHIIGVSFLRDLYTQESLHFVVGRAQLEYKSPARHGDTLVIETEGHFSRSPAVTFNQNAYVREGETGQTRLAVTAAITIVLLNGQNRPVRMSDSIIEAFRQYKAQASS